MKKLFYLSVPLGLLLPGCASKPAPPPAPVAYQEFNSPAVRQPIQRPQGGPVYVYDQKVMGAQPQGLISQDQAQATIDRFREAYPKLGRPRLLIYVNRELVDTKSGMKLIRHDERIERTVGGTNAEPAVHSVEKNAYRSDGKTEATLADKQTVRDVERLFGRPMRAAGASLVDQNVAAQTLADKPLAEFIGSTDTPQARKDREAIAKIADVVVEILISSKSITAPAISGDQTLTVPDIQATAIRLSDSKILAQSSSGEMIARVPASSLGNLDVSHFAEATSLALMDEMSSEAK